MVLRSRWAADRGRRKQAVGGGLLEGNCVAVQRTAGRRGMVPQCGMDKTAPAQRKIPTAERGRPVADQRERAVCSGKRRPAAAGRAATAVRRGHEADKKVMRDYCSAFLPFAAQTTAICRAGLLRGHSPPDTKKGLTVLPASPCCILWSRRRDLNPQPADYKSAALPIELHRRRQDSRLVRRKNQGAVVRRAVAVISPASGSGAVPVRPGAGAGRRRSRRPHAGGRPRRG